MSTKKIAGNPTMALASLIRPEQDRLLAMRAAEHDSFVMLDGRPMISSSPLIHRRHSHSKSLFDLLAAGVKNTGDRLSIVRISDAKIGVYYEEAGRHQSESDVISAYGDYISSIGCPARFARSWNDFTSLMLGTVATIVVGIEALLAARGRVDIDSRIVREVDLAMIEGLTPHITALRRFFDASASFGRNGLVVDRWEEAFSRGQRHLLGNALSPVIYINRFADAGELTYRDLVDALEEVYKIFDPIAHIRESYSEDIIGRWLRINVLNEGPTLIRPRSGVALRRVVDEIVYRAGTTGGGSPREIEVEWIEGVGTLFIRAQDDALSPFDVGTPARRLVTKTYGMENLNFIRDGRGRVSEIRVAVTERTDTHGSGAAGGGGQAALGSGSSDPRLAGAQTYTTGAAAGYATISAVSGMATSLFCL